MLVFIKIKGWTGCYNAVVTWFYKANIDELKYRIERIYNKEYGEEIPNYFHSIETIKELKQFV